MTDKERLIELLRKSGASFENALPEEIADYLLANGVFILPEDLSATEDFSISAFIEAMQMYKEKDRYIKPPCKVGEKAFFLLQIDGEWQLCEETVVDFSTKGFYYSEFLDGSGAQILVPYEEAGETVFFNKEEAEKVLVGRRTDNGQNR